MPLSGRQWVDLFPASDSTADLAGFFRGSVDRFVSALRAAGATVTIDDTLRPPERAYLMHFSFRIAREAMDPAIVPAMQGVDVQWVHLDPQGRPDLLASRAAAEEMVQGYGVVFRPALTSRHTEGRAIDMTIGWRGNLTISNARGDRTTIASLPRSGENTALQRVGASYGVRKLASDPPHWSSDGH